MHTTNEISFNNVLQIEPLVLKAVLSPISLDSIPDSHAVNRHNNHAPIPMHSSTFIHNPELAPYIGDDILREHLLITHCELYAENSANQLDNQNFTNMLDKEECLHMSQIDLNLPYNKSSASWCIATSPNFKYMSWNAGQGHVYLIPLINIPTINQLKIGQYTPFSSQTCLHGSNSKIKCQGPALSTIVIDCGAIVWSMAFGSKNVSDSRHYKAYQSYQKQMNRLYIKTPNFRDKVLTYNKEINFRQFYKNGQIHNRLDFSKEDCILATGLANGQIKIWQVPTGRLMLLLYDHKGPVASLHFIPHLLEFKLLSGSTDRTLKVWDMSQDGNMTPTIDAFEYQTRILKALWYPHLVPFQGPSKIISVGGSNKAHIWKYSTKSTSYVHAKVLTGHLNEVVDCDFSCDGALLLTAGKDSYAILWDAWSYDALKIFGHMSPPPRPIFASGPNNHGLRGIQFISDDHLFVSVADDGYVRVWDINSGSENPSRVGRQDYPLCCQFSANPGIIATGDKYGRLMIWGMCDSHYHMGPQGSKNILCQHRKHISRTHRKNRKHGDAEDSLFIKPYRLQHLCRLTVRTFVPDSTVLEKYFRLGGEATLPQKLVAYLLYKDVKIQDVVLSPNYPYIVNG